MGLMKRPQFDHSLESVFEAAGYSDDVVAKELEPRARLLAEHIVRVALTDPLSLIGVFLNSPVLKDNSLDSRDRATIVMLSGRFLASAAFQQSSGPEAAGHREEPAERLEELKISDVEWNTLVHHVDSRVFGSGKEKASEHIEGMQGVLDDPGLSGVQKAVIEALVLKESVMGGREDSISSLRSSRLHRRA